MNPNDRDVITALVEKQLPPVISKTSLAVLFGYSPKFLGAIHANPDRYYRTFFLSKGKSKRRIDAPKVALKVIQKWAGYHLARSIRFLPCVVGFVPGISAINGAAQHCGNTWVFSTDIENFFQTTSEDFVASTLCSHGYSAHGAKVFAHLACLNGGLAQGSPCSPVLSNMCFRKIDQIISDYASNLGLVYTRYADDISISGQRNPPDDIAFKVIKAIESAGWKISAQKTRMWKSPSRLKVYGLLVNGPSPRLTKGYRNRIRALKHLAETGRLDPEREEIARGHLAYSSSIDKYRNDH